MTLVFTTEYSFMLIYCERLFKIQRKKNIRPDLIQGARDAERERNWIRPEWLMVVLVLPCWLGEISLNLLGSASILPTWMMRAVGIANVMRFNAFSRPKADPEQSLRLV
jgi:hypothetical protein